MINRKLIHYVNVEFVMIRSFKVVLVLSWLAVVEKLIQIENDQQEVVTHQLNMHFLNNTIRE